MSDASIVVNTHSVSDEVYVFETSGGKIGLTIEDSTGRYAATFLTPEEWDVVRMHADGIARKLRAEREAGQDALAKLKGQSDERN